MRSASCIRRVDFPIPGSPATRTREPGTTPPPSTRANSPMGSGQRVTSAAATAGSGTGWAPGFPARPTARTVGAGDISTRVFHSPQSGQRPIHFGCTAPHF
jgi:hypothetical protein